MKKVVRLDTIHTNLRHVKDNNLFGIILVNIFNPTCASDFNFLRKTVIYLTISTPDIIIVIAAQIINNGVEIMKKKVIYLTTSTHDIIDCASLVNGNRPLIINSGVGITN